MNLDELTDIINDIKMKPTSFDLDDMSKELKNIQFRMLCKQTVIQNINKWITANPRHTFPKKEKKWINTIRSHRNLICIKYKCDVKELLLSIKNNKPVPDYMKGLKYYVYDIIKYGDYGNKPLFNCNEHITIYGGAEDAYQHLFDSGILYKYDKYSRVHIRKYTLFQFGLKKIKRNCDDDIDKYLPLTKRKIVLSEPCFKYKNSSVVSN